MPEGRGLSLKERLEDGERLLGGWLNTASPVAAEILSGAGYDFLLIDQEHAPVDLEKLHSLLTAVEANDAWTAVRVPSHDPGHLKRVLDLGCEAIMIPAVGSADEARAVIAACRYPPGGRRGLALSVVRASGYGRDVTGYAASRQRRQLLMMQIETTEGLDAVDEIAALDGVDLLFIGPNDLAAAIGCFGQLDHPALHAAMARIEEAAQRHGKFLGTIPVPGRSATALFAAGYAMVIGGSDVEFLRQGAEKFVYAFKKPGMKKA